jgi:RNA polymerase sigma-70 factor, ECF subfamily
VAYLENLKELIEGCINGKRHSQNELYKLLAPKMFIVCQRYSKNRQEAEEILQEGFIRVFTFLHQYKFNGSFEGWVRKIMVNCALQKYRFKKEMHAVIDIENVAINNYGREDVLSRIHAKELLEMIQQLSPAYRTIFNLYVFEGMKHREIAELLGISEGTSKSNLSDARAFLKKAIQRSMTSENKNVNEV